MRELIRRREKDQVGFEIRDHRLIERPTIEFGQSRQLRVNRGERSRLGGTRREHAGQVDPRMVEKQTDQVAPRIPCGARDNGADPTTHCIASCGKVMNRTYKTYRTCKSYKSYKSYS